MLTLRSAALGFMGALALLAAPVPAVACGADSPCMVDGGEYRIALPSGAQPGEKLGAIVFFHGWQGSAAGVMANKGLMRAADDLGVALVSPHGAGKTWSYPGSPRQNRDEFAFVEAMMVDVLARFPIDPEKVMASGFSMGGSMVWFLACQTPARFAGFAPIAGAFWEPLPASCATPAPDLPYLFHVHGTADTVVPLAGRPIRDIWRQGDTFESIDVMLRPLGAAVDKRAAADAPFECTTWTPEGDGAIELCLHDGGHNIRPDWVASAWNKLSTAKGWAPLSQ